jgi:hypothetical protein
MGEIGMGPQLRAVGTVTKNGAGLEPYSLANEYGAFKWAGLRVAPGKSPPHGVHVGDVHGNDSVPFSRFP